MTVLCGWLAEDAAADPAGIVASMGRALRSHGGQVWAQWSLPGMGVGLLEVPRDGEPGARYAPAMSDDGRHHLWFAGEAFHGGALVDVADADSTRTRAFRAALLDALLSRGADALRSLDGEYQLVWWDGRERLLTIANDRFGGLPLYWARSGRGFAWAGGVRGVLMAPGVSADPDPEAVREAVTFGGYRLDDRTNVAAVKMLPGASVLGVRNGAHEIRRYWRWSDISPVEAGEPHALIDAVHERWRTAVRRRLSGAKRPGQTLSGGLDSRAILAEAAPQVPRWTAITYGIPGCDDARYAELAARAVGADWVFHELYSGRSPDWLERRTNYVQATDGLIDLVDLMHLEALPLQAELLDVHLSGYIGDAVSGPTFNEVDSAEVALLRMPYYGTEVSFGWPEALERVEALMAALGGAQPRYTLFEHKLPQSTNRWSAAWRPYFRVRKPFVDYAFFDFCQGLPSAVRGPGSFHERWLSARYPGCFARIPNHKTGVPVLSPPWRVLAARAGRVAWRRVQPVLAGVGLPARPRLRSYHPDDQRMSAPEVRDRIEAAILRPGSIVCEILGREPVGRVLARWFDRAQEPAQVVGALYVYETYHAGLAAHLKAAAQ